MKRVVTCDDDIVLFSGCFIATAQEYYNLKTVATVTANRDEKNLGVS